MCAIFRVAWNTAARVKKSTGNKVPPMWRDRSSHGITAACTRLFQILFLQRRANIEIPRRRRITQLPRKLEFTRVIGSPRRSRILFSVLPCNKSSSEILANHLTRACALAAGANGKKAFTECVKADKAMGNWRNVEVKSELGGEQKKSGG